MELAAGVAEKEFTRTWEQVLNVVTVAITGFADKGEEPGLVHFACARAGRKTAHREEHFGPIGRGATRIESLRVAVEMMTEML